MNSELGTDEGLAEGALATHRAGVDGYDADLPVPQVLWPRSTPRVRTHLSTGVFWCRHAECKHGASMGLIRQGVQHASQRHMP